MTVVCSSPCSSGTVIPPVHASKDVRDGWIKTESLQVGTGTSSGHSVCGSPKFQDFGDKLPNSKTSEIVAHAYNLFFQSHLSFYQVSHFLGSFNWASGLIQLGRWHPKLTTTLQLYGSDKPIYSTISFVPFGTSPPDAAMAGPLFPYYLNLYPAF